MNNNYYEQLLTNTNSFSISIYLYSESGLFLSQVDALRNDALFEFNKKNRLYFTIQEYEEDMTKFDNLSFGNFKMLFVFTICAHLLLLLIFIVHHAVLKIYRRWQRGRRRKRRRRIQEKLNAERVFTVRRLHLESLYADIEENQYKPSNLNAESSETGRKNEHSLLKVQTLKNDLETQAQVHPSPAVNEADRVGEVSTY